MRILKKGTYYGALHSEVNIEGVVLSEYDYVLPHTDWHYHENPYFMYVLRGNVYDMNKVSTELCNAGSLIFHNWQEPHWNKNDKVGTRGFHIEFERTWFEKNKLDARLWEGSQLIEKPSVHHVLARIYSEFKHQDQYSEASIELLMLELCEEVSGERNLLRSCTPPWIESLKELVRSHTGPFNLKELSDQLGVHPVHLSRSVPKYMSTTLGEYIREVKVTRSVGLLLDSTHSLSEIAYLCDFSDQSHFTRSFRKYIGTTPSQFKRKLQ